MSDLRVVEICAGAGGQAAETLRDNLGGVVAVGDVADSSVWRPVDYAGVALLAGGVPCPPFSIAGKQLGSSDERDLFAWAIEQVEVMQPRALLLENVRGLASSRFASYRQRVLDRLMELGYVADWRLLHASDFGLPQLRPRFVLVAMRPDDASYFRWPEAHSTRTTVGESLRDLMAANGWPFASDWAEMANGIGPTLVGGSKKHGGADLGPTRAKAAWAALGVDGKGVANEAPGPDWPHPTIRAPRLTIEMVARIQGWDEGSAWRFAGGKTAQYRQIGNAFPPPVAEAVGRSIKAALLHEGVPREIPELAATVHDPIYRALSSATGFVSIGDLLSAMNLHSQAAVERRLAVIARDFDLVERKTRQGLSYKLGQFKGFVGQDDHDRHAYFEKHRNRVS